MAIKTFYPKKALVTGINGQDGSYLCEFLLDKGYEVHGTVRRNSIVASQNKRVEHLKDRITTHYMDLTDEASIRNVINSIIPDEVYNLAAQSHVQVSSKVPGFTIQTNTLGVLHILETILDLRRQYFDVRLYQASTSEMFGNSVDDDGFQRETTPMNPVSPYAISKLAAYHLTKHYREAYNLYICNGILFNHCSPRRGENFVTQKIIKGAKTIAEGKATELRLGNLDSFRDEGDARDYVEAMWLMLQQDKPDDYIVATGETHSVREFCAKTFDYLGLDYTKYVVQDKEFMRPQELNYLKGDASKAEKILGWKPKFNYDAIIRDMIQHAEC